ncbi:MAG: hypothetical protein JNM17_03705 [Archangium sp.]|nr:hypothetical protein [Archangium sp.]
MTPMISQSAFPPAPANASTCPKCNAALVPSPHKQTCACGLELVFRHGALSDGSVRVSPQPGAKELKLRAPGLVVVSQAVLRHDAIGYGALDPVIGRFPIDEKGVRFEHLYTVAVWRQLNIASLVTFILISVPLGLGSLLGMVFSKGEPASFICGLPFLLLAAFHGYRVLGARATRMRVIGFKDRTLNIEFTGSLGKRREFVGEFFSRSGLGSVELP